MKHPRRKWPAWYRKIYCWWTKRDERRKIRYEAWSRRRY